MISFFKNKEKNKVNDDKSYSNIAALLIHVAKIDENYEDKEKEIIKKTLIELGAASSNIDKLISEASVIEENSNQILNFTREVKNAPLNQIKLELLSLYGKLFIRMIMRICMRQI